MDAWNWKSHSTSAPNRRCGESEERVDLALDAAGIGQWDLDLATGLVTRSRRHQQIIGEVDFNPSATRAEFYENVVAEDRPGVEQKLRLAIETGEACEFECRIMQREGEPRWLWASGKVIQNEHGKPVRIRRQFSGYYRPQDGRAEVANSVGAAESPGPDHARHRRAPGSSQHLPGGDPESGRQPADRFWLRLPLQPACRGSASSIASGCAAKRWPWIWP